MQFTGRDRCLFGFNRMEWWHHHLALIGNELSGCHITRRVHEGTSQLCHAGEIGIKELIASDLDDYISLASKIGLDCKLRSSLVEEIKAAKHKLFQ